MNIDLWKMYALCMYVFTVNISYSVFVAGNFTLFSILFLAMCVFVYTLTKKNDADVIDNYLK